MFLHGFPSMFVSSLREFPENCVLNKHGELCFVEYLHRKLLAANFLSYDIESARKKCIYWIGVFKTIHFLFYSDVFNSRQNRLNILVQISYFLC